ncbi:MAG TPA: 50S ribosomal protein L17 [Candidatus Saccharimonadales bacterium]|jgi:large subunit ribosomal protein L17|nr:50S ribosomal protein L17 [Candidatus Saccharimonadales bacterium]
MRHLKRTAKLGRTGQHRNRMLASLVCSLIKHRRVKTTLAKARAARSVAEKMITLGKAGTLHDRRLASARLHQDEDAIKILFNEIAPTQKERRGGYTRIIRLGQRQGDAAQMVLLEFVDVPVPEAPVEPAKSSESESRAKPEAEAKVQEKQEAAAPA